MGARWIFFVTCFWNRRKMEYDEFWYSHIHNMHYNSFENRQMYRRSNVHRSEQASWLFCNTLQTSNWLQDDFSPPVWDIAMRCGTNRYYLTLRLPSRENINFSKFICIISWHSHAIDRNDLFIQEVKHCFLLFAKMSACENSHLRTFFLTLISPFELKVKKSTGLAYCV